ncbi:hypothetical protein AKJ09_03266 [Labilithrix luteola]|uniref:Uncharacterized protein n=1 Tax=Labilithrix luteola TaxID=1391654 RepID=A0A0K1PSV7_9BACT|nr:hypothetical protein [Labilithrix luteola]AKU96602.1 hypothetical protein AKJ09_03266 [Labilithrix luteola]
MSSDETELSPKQSEALSRPSLGGGRLGTYTILGAASGIVPLPWVPDAIVRRVRGALVHELASRHGLSLAPEARTVLVEPAGTEGPRGMLSQGVVFAVTRVLGRFGPLGAIPPVRSALGTFVLGHLLSRYLETARTARSVRIDVEEARRVRRAIDQALLYALTTEARASREDKPFSPDDQRDQTTQIIDGVIISIANAPDWLVRRLDAAFDEVLSSVRA